MALNFARKKTAKKSDDLSRERMVELYTIMLADLKKEVGEAIAKGRDLVSRGAPAELLVASMTEQYPMMAMYAEEVLLNKQGLTREQVLAAVEKFEKDEELDALLTEITGLSEMFNVLKDEAIEAQPLPDHVTKELILQIAQENADMTLHVIKSTSAKQKEDKLSDEQAAELAEKEAQASQQANFDKHNLTQDVMTAAILKFSTEDESFGEKMQEISGKLSMAMHELRAAELGMTPEQLALQNEINMAAQALAEQGLSPEEISRVLAASLQLRDNDEKAVEEHKKKSGKKGTGKKRGGKKSGKPHAHPAASAAAAAAAGDEDDEEDDEEDEEEEQQGADAASAPAAATSSDKPSTSSNWNDVE